MSYSRFSDVASVPVRPLQVNKRR